MKKNEVRLPAEWEKQQIIQLSLPHKNSDWNYMLNEATECFVNIATAIVKYQKLLIIHPEIEIAKKILAHLPQDKIIYAEIPTNDTWSRDYGAITVIKNGVPTLLDFTFNGWGMKFAANLDNQTNKQLFKKDIFPKSYKYKCRKRFIIEGGSIESDGKGTILTTTECLMSENRNNISKKEIEKKLNKYLGAKRVLWINSGYLAGDDTDSHIDTLARLCNEDTIAYVKCTDEHDEHYNSLKKMEQEIKQFRLPHSTNGYKLIPLPMAPKRYDENNKRLPATYANFLIINSAVLMPTYGDEDLDNRAKVQLQKAFPEREIIQIDCQTLINQHGSLHCVTMQYI